MPACFQLIRKGETAPVPLMKIDEEMCAHFKARVDANRYYGEWYNTIGFSLAMGKTFAQLHEQAVELAKPRPDDDADTDLSYVTMQLRIIEWLMANFDSNAFYSRNH